jgi:hypothetical protein
MSLSPSEIGHWLQAPGSRASALVFVDQLARALTGLEALTLTVMVLSYARSFLASAKVAPCASRS